MPNIAGTQLVNADVVRGNNMRKYLATLVFGGCALMSAPLVATEVSSAVVIEPAPARVSIRGLRDEAAMLLVGTALIGLAAAVRRAA